jgi:hypothetical protein
VDKLVVGWRFAVWNGKLVADMQVGQRLWQLVLKVGLVDSVTWLTDSEKYSGVHCFSSALSFRVSGGGCGGHPGDLCLDL